MPLVQDTPTKIVCDLKTITAAFLPGIGNGQTTGNIFCSGNTFIGLLISKTFVSGDLSFFGSLTGQPNTYYQLTDSLGNLISVSTTALGSILTPPSNPSLGTVEGIQLALDPAVFASVQNLIIYCSNAQTVAQNVQLVMAPVLSS